MREQLKNRAVHLGDLPLQALRGLFISSDLGRQTDAANRGILPWSRWAGVGWMAKVVGPGGRLVGVHLTAAAKRAIHGRRNGRGVQTRKCPSALLLLKLEEGQRGRAMQTANCKLQTGEEVPMTQAAKRFDFLWIGRRRRRAERLLCRERPEPHGRP